jgi:hypothetical protein
LHPGGFSCRNARDFNSEITQIANIHALFENAVNLQPSFGSIYAFISLLPS